MSCIIYTDKIRKTSNIYFYFLLNKIKNLKFFSQDLT